MDQMIHDRIYQIYRDYYKHMNPMMNNNMGNFANYNYGFPYQFHDPFQMFYLMLYNKMEILLCERNMIFADYKIKNLWRNKFLDIYIMINNINDWKKKGEGEKKLIINFYDICQKEIYFDCELKIENLISFILAKMKRNEKLIIKRLKNNQTTKYLTENLIPEDFDSYFDIYEDPLYFEYNGTNLFSLKQQTGEEIGLNEGDQIELRINSNTIRYNTQLPKGIIECKFQSTSGARVCIRASLNETIQSLINKFYEKSDLDPTRVGNRLAFISNAKRLDVNSDQLLETFNSTRLFIVVYDAIVILPIRGFVAEDSEEVNYLDIHENRNWRIVHKGLNIFGICNNPSCQKYNTEVVYPTILENQKLVFNLYKEILNIKCPICQKIIKVKKFGFWKCEYQIIGKKIVEGELTDFDSTPKETNGDNLEYFALFENAETQWTELSVYVISKQETQYESN